MKRITATFVLVLLLVLTSTHAPLGQAAPAGVRSPAYVPAETTGQFRVLEWTGIWKDETRARTIPVHVYYPDAPGPFPVILFSHGLGGTCDGYRYLGECWASRGYVSVHVQHPGSDSSVLLSAHPFRAMVEAAQNPQNALDRPKDISFSLDMLARLEPQPAFPLKGRMDLRRVGVGGHSFGAFTALAAAGRVLGSPRTGTLDLRDPRIRACVALSAPSKGKGADCPSYEEFKVPCLHMTGTEDASPIGDTAAADRRVPFDCINLSEQYLVTFRGGDHMVFSGRLRGFPKATDAAFQRLVCVATTAFWDAYLKDDAAAKAWLAGGGFQRELGSSGTFEEKVVRR